MKPTAEQSKLALCMVPLLRCIAQEIKERTLAITELESKLEAFAGTRRAHRDEVASLESQLSHQRLELRHVEKELANLGWERDQDHPLRLVLRRAAGAPEMAWRPGETGFFRRPVERPA